ncbi:MAG: RHS repeat-associated core domain-containing protein [Pseudomonadota bacterium]
MQTDNHNMNTKNHPAFVARVIRRLSGGIGKALFALSMISIVAPATSVLAASVLDVRDAVGVKAPAVTTGQSATQLADGRWLLLGGEDNTHRPTDVAMVIDPKTGVKVTLTAKLTVPRIGHSATLLADGTILIIGGVAVDGAWANQPERFDPVANRFTVITTLTPKARAYHSATLLSDGRLLIAGGQSTGIDALSDAEIITPTGHHIQRLSLPAARRAHYAALLPATGRVLLQGGMDKDGKPLTNGDAVDPTSHTVIAESVTGVTTLLQQETTTTAPTVAASIPTAGADNVAVGQVLSTRFTRLLKVTSLNADTVTLFGPSGATPITIVPAENGLLLFVTPKTDLTPATRYTLFINGAMDTDGHALPFTAISFTVASSNPTKAVSVTPLDNPIANLALSTENVLDDELWVPGGRHFSGDWTYGSGTKGILRKATAGAAITAADDYIDNIEVHAPVPLTAPAGTTALAGLVNRINGKPLANVTLSIGPAHTKTDAYGRFLLTGIAAGPQTLVIDGATANHANAKYGVFLDKVDIKGNQTTALNYTIWLPTLDPKGTVKIASPTREETVVTSAAIPGLELRIPAGTVIRDRFGKIVTELNITAIPVDRPPFPLPSFQVPVYFTIQPGGAWLQGLTSSAAKGARLIYPNYTNELAGARAGFWNYDAKDKGWYLYGMGSISRDRQQVVPDPGVVIYELTGAMINGMGGVPPATAQAPGAGNSCPSAADGGGNDSGGAPTAGCGGSGSASGTAVGDPVDSATGLYIQGNTDLALPDVMPLALTRTYRQNDANSRSFGVGMTHPYDMFLWSAREYKEADLVLPDGARVHYVRTSLGDGWTDAVFEHTSSPTGFHKSTIVWNGTGWDLKLTDGTVYVYGENAPLQSIRDRYGNTTTILRTGTNHLGNQVGNITQITSPNGRWMQFTYDGTSNRISQAKDNGGRLVQYFYDAYGRLNKVTDPNNGNTIYGWGTCTGSEASCTWLQTIQDARGNIRLTNEYDPATGRVKKQTMADTATYQFAYTVDGSGKITQTDVTNPRGDITRKTFQNGYATVTTLALGKTEQQITTIQRDPVTNLTQQVTDPLNRITKFQYDTAGNTTSVTQLFNTANAVTTNYTYEPKFNRIETVTDPLTHKTTFTYDDVARTVVINDPLSHKTTLTYTTAGLLANVTDALGSTHKTSFTYDGSDLATITDARSRKTTIFTDAVGNIGAIIDPLGNRTALTHDVLKRLKQTTDALGNNTASNFDSNNNLKDFTDPRGGKTQWTYEVLNRVQTRIDPLLKTENYHYDLAGNLDRYTDRKGQVTGFTYDFLNRPTQVGFGATTANPTAYTSTVTYTWDAGNRVRVIVDSQNGTIRRDYDDLDRLTQEVTPQGTVQYTLYDAASRLKTMHVAGQPDTAYTWDNVNRLTRIVQGTQTVIIGYDNANRRTSVTLPNGVVKTYAYDDPTNYLTSITYKKGTTTIGDLTYKYDAAGRRIAMGGSLAKTNLPAVITSTSYDANNRLTNWNGGVITYDDNGNMENVFGQTYSWNARNQLTAMSGSATTTFRYDAFGRRRGKTINGSVTNFLYDGVQPIQELTSTNTIKRTMLTGGVDELFSMTEGTTTQSFFTDALGSTLALTDSTGATQTSYSYEAYGKIASAGTASNNAYQYTGRENDSTGLQLNRNRYYSYELKRWISEDPIGLAGGYNQYAYVNGDPIDNVDPTGLICFNWDQFSNDVRDNRFDLDATLGSLASTLGVGTMPKTSSELRALGQPKNQINPITNQLSRWSGRLGTRVLRDIGRTTVGIAAGTLSTGSVVLEGFYDWGVIGTAAINATSSNNCDCSSGQQ